MENKEVVNVFPLLHENYSEIKEHYKAQYYSTPPMRAITGLKFPDGTICKYGEWIVQYSDESFCVKTNEELQTLFQPPAPPSEVVYSREDMGKAWNGGFCKGHADGADIEKYTDNPDFETFINSLKPSPVYREPLFRMVKCSERLPEVSKGYHVSLCDKRHEQLFPAVILFTMGMWELDEDYYDVVEWLEQLPTSPSDKTGEGIK